MYKKVITTTVSGLLMISIIVAAVAFSSRGALAKPAVSFTNVQVNQVFPGPFPTNKQNEPSLAQNPTKSLNLIAGSNDEIGEPACTNTTPLVMPVRDRCLGLRFLCLVRWRPDLAMPGAD